MLRPAQLLRLWLLMAVLIWSHLWVLVCAPAIQLFGEACSRDDVRVGLALASDSLSISICTATTAYFILQLEQGGRARLTR